jgi:8-oxo-dGTP pyrophosphatase MutT (NUDIX family)
MIGSARRPRIFLKDRRTVFENSRFRVFSDHIRDAAGREVKDYLVVAPNASTAGQITGVTILPLWNNRIVLLKTFRHPIRRTILEAPRGFIDADETAEEAALRELQEETGLVCKPDRLVALGTCIPEAGVISARLALFAALDCRFRSRTDTEEVGLGKCVSFSLRVAQKMVADMVLEDATTSLSLHRFFMFKANREDSLRVLSATKGRLKG